MSTYRPNSFFHSAALLFLLVGCGGEPPSSGQSAALPASVAVAARPAAITVVNEVAGPQGSQPGQPIDDGGNDLITDAVADRLAQAGGWVRLHFRLGPYPSDTSAFYSKYDRIVDRLRARGLQIMGLMSNESWHGSQADWTANNIEHGGSDGYNSYIDQFGYAFKRIAQHYEGKIRHWEIWNEPNCWATNPSPGTYEGCSYIYPSNFAAMLAHTHSQVHYYNHIDVQIVSGGLFGHDIGGYGSGPGGADYLADTYQIGLDGGMFAWAMSTYGSYPLDAIGYHIYIDQGGAVNSGWFGTYLDYIRGVVERYEGAGSSKKTWLTEWGWSRDEVDESTQSKNLGKALTVIKSKSYVEHSFWFQLDDGPFLHFGLFRADGSARPALATFRSGASYPGKRSDGGSVSAIANYFSSHGGMAVHGSPYDNGGSAWAHYWDYGYVQDFDGGSLGASAIFDTGHRVALGFWQVYLSGYHSRLRFPTSEEYPSGSGVRQDFQGGYMTWNARDGVQVH